MKRKVRILAKMLAILRPSLDEAITKDSQFGKVGKPTRAEPKVKCPKCGHVQYPAVAGCEMCAAPLTVLEMGKKVAAHD